MAYNMADKEIVTILKVGTEEAVSNIGDLRNNIKVLKENLEGLEIGTEEYQDTLKELTENQTALRNAMYATTASMEDVAKAAKGTGQSYNALVAQMAQYKAELRATDTSTEEGQKRFKELASSIKDINEQLKDLDARQGNYQRNVGDYANQMIKGFKDLAKDIPSFAKNLHGPLDDVSKSMGLIATNPVFGIATLLVPVISQITAGLKENKTALDAVHKIMEALQPVFNVLQNAIEKAVEWVADLIGKLADLAGESTGTFKTIVTGAVGVGNALLQFILTPIRTVIEAVKGLGGVFSNVVKGNFKDAAKDAKEALSGIGDAFKKGFSFKGNFEAGQKVGEEFAAGLSSKSGKAKAAGAKVGKDAAEEAVKAFEDALKKASEGIDAEIEIALKVNEAELPDISAELAAINAQADKALDRTLADIDKATQAELTRASQLAELATADAEGRIQSAGKTAEELLKIEQERAAKEYEIQSRAKQMKLDLLEEARVAALDRGDIDAALALEQEAADLEVEIEQDKTDRIIQLRQQASESAQKSFKEQIAVLQAAASATSDILSALADMYEANGKEDTKAAKRAKNLRIAGATIDMLQGAVTAFATAQSLGPVAGPIVGGINAAAVIAAGTANIAKIKATNADGTGTADTSAEAPATTASTQATVQAPVQEYTPPEQLRTITTSSEEDRLNRMADPQRVYIVQSDIEAAGKRSRVQVAEATF